MKTSAPETVSVHLTQHEIEFLQKVLRVVEAYPETKEALLTKLASALEQLPHEASDERP